MIVPKGEKIINWLELYTKNWVGKQPSANDIFGAKDQQKIVDIIKQLHYCNFILWNKESEIRDAIRGGRANIVLKLKQEIDEYNLKRNKLIEKIDEIVFQELRLHNFEDTTDNIENIKQNYYINSETIGQIIDRLSIFTLKIVFRKIKNIQNKELTRQRDYVVACFDKFIVYLKKGKGYTIKGKSYKIYEKSKFVEELT